VNSLNIFVVEDDVDFAEGLAETLEMEGHNVEIANSGEDAIARFQEKDFDLTFMDVRLPGKNGVESFLEIRALKPEARVMMMTGYSLQHLLDEAMDGGALGVLQKPFDIGRAVDLADSVGQGSRVLLIEDDADFGILIKEMLEKNGHWVKHCYDGTSAIRACRAGGVDVVFLDLRLNGVTGLDVFKSIRKIDSDLPIVVLTAFASEENESINEMQSMSQTEVISKPVNPDKLLDCINNLNV
jgi:two-component system response regulator HydG